MSKIKFITLLGFLSISLVVSASTSTDKYVEEIKAYYQKMQKYAHPKSGRVYHVKYKEQVIPQKLTSKTTTANVEVFSSENRFYYYTGVVDVLQDKDQSFMVIHREKKVYQSPSVPNQNARVQYESYLKIQDKFFNKGKVLLSEVVTLNGRKMARVSIQMPKLKDQGNLKVVRTTYWYDIVAKKVWKTKVDYQQTYSIKSRIITYDEIDLDYDKKLKKSAFRKVLNSKGKLVSPYENYKLIKNN